MLVEGLCGLWGWAKLESGLSTYEEDREEEEEKKERE